MNEFARKIDHLEVTIDPYAPLYSEPITFVDQCKLLSEPIKKLQIAWGNKDTFPRVLEILMRMNWYSQRLPLQPKGSFARPSGFMECSIKRAVHTLQILTTISFYPRLPTIRKYQEIERVKLTAVIAALLSSVGEPAVNFEVVSYDDNHQLIRRKNEYERLDNFLNEDVETIHINFQDPPPKEFYSSIAIDLMHEIVPGDLMHDIAQAYDRNLRRFLQNFIGRNLIQAEVANPKLFNCLVTADFITQELEFAYSGRRVDKTPLPHLQHEMEIILVNKFKSDWSM
ncbi:MAG: hypothetical protein LUC43_08330, partial [Burkholderiales bacterium]|nr:hypothetical protein [Burkholderiales bacterium]